MKKYEGIIIFALLACLSLSAAFFIGQNPSAPDKDAAIKSNVSFRENAENGENKEDEDNLKEQLSEEEANAETTVKPTKGEEKGAEKYLSEILKHPTLPTVSRLKKSAL